MVRRSARLAGVDAKTEQGGTSPKPAPSKASSSGFPKRKSARVLGQKKAQEAAIAAKSAEIEKESAIQRSGLGLAKEQRLWKKGFKTIAGVDEAGRGPLAGELSTPSYISNPGQLAQKLIRKL